MLKKVLLSTIWVLVSLSIPVAQAASLEIPSDGWKGVAIEEFKTGKGDYFFADLKNSVGYLINEERKVFTSFPVLSGQKRYVRYLGRSYFAATPEQTWDAKERVIQSDRVTFSKNGLFLRLFKDGKPTKYGIHGHKYFDLMNSSGTKYRSFGCIIVEDSVLLVIERSFNANGGALTVVSSSNRDELPFRGADAAVAFSGDEYGGANYSIQ